MLIRNAYVFQSVLESVSKVIVLIAIMVSLVSCGHVQASDTTKRQEARCNERRSIADPLAPFYADGLPKDAYPVAFYGQDTISYSQLEVARKRDYLGQSSLANGIQDFGTFYFFIQPIADSEDEFSSFYNIWMYDDSAKKLRKIFSHHVGTYTEMQIDGVYWNYDIQNNDETYRTSSGGKGLIHRKNATPIVVIAARNTSMTPHPTYLTVILNPVTNKKKVVEEKFIGFMSMDDTSLPVAEQGLARKVILTTKSRLLSKDIPAPEDDDFAVRNFIYPSLNVYSTTGNRIGAIELPHEEIDVVR
ncbi:hypothetical protein [Prevotella falsenii]|uniref:hypothetical protein n=1 Tax=Prevotella falsenii TaxID=515414 RepID=UPI0004682920|nr:hypothetical protein [Prevotella falsenii]